MIRPALTHVGKQLDPALSPDGQHIAFAWQGPGEGGYDSTNDYNLWVQQIDSNEPIQLTHHAEEERLPSWSPDGLSLVYPRFSFAENSCGIYRVPLIGGYPSRLAACPPSLRWLDVSPDGRSLAVSASQSADEPRGISLLDLETGALRRLTWAPANSLGDHQPAVSPNGRWVAFTRHLNPYRQDLMVVAIDGSGAKALTSDAWGQVDGVAWSADSGSVLFSSNRVGRQ